MGTTTHPRLLPYPGVDPDDLASLRRAVPPLHAWFAAAARDLPWRRTPDPYAVWVSEAMLQQTRVAAVIPYYERWMSELPTVEDLARADEHRVLLLWEGLGYYSRARNLHRAAQIVAEELGGQIPRDALRFQALPGVGPYVAAAVLSIAFGKDLAAVDANVRRVLCRLQAFPTAPGAGALQALALAILPPGAAAIHNQAMMELGAQVCLPGEPRCAPCPLAPACRARATGTPAAYPAKKAKRAVPHAAVALGIVFREGRVLIDRRPYGGLLGGLWEFPGGKVEDGESPAEALIRELREELGLEVDVGPALPPVDHAYTHLRVTLHPFVCRFRGMDGRAGEGRPYLWVDPTELPSYAMPRANRKVIERLKAVGPLPPALKRA